MKKTIYIRYAKDLGNREDKVAASIKPRIVNLKSQPYDKFDLQTIFLEVEIEIPDEMFGFKKVEAKSKIQE